MGSRAGRKGWLVPLLVWGLAGSLPAASTTYQVDFGPGNSPLADGFEAGELPTLEPVADAAFGISPVGGGKPIEVAFKGDVSGYGLGDETKPLTTDGIFTVGSKHDVPTEIAFTVSGLPPGAKVTFSAIEAWNGRGRAAYLSLGDSGVVDLAGPEIAEGDTVPPPEFVVVGENLTVPPSGVLQGVFANTDGTNFRPEGQCGAFRFVVEMP